jgi:hypothetical protein
MTVEEALEHRNILESIAVELYGDFWITNLNFWNSSTELQMREIIEFLSNENFLDKYSNPTPEEIALAEIIIEEFKLKNEFEEDDVI